MLTDRVAIWNGTSWANIDCNLPGTTTAWSFIKFGTRFYIGFSSSGTAVTSASTTVTNPGTSTTYPVLHLKNSTAAALAILWIKNETIDKTLWFNYTVQPGEELVIDFRPARRSALSSYYFNAWRSLLRSSDVAEFYLIPGANQITAYGGSGLTAWLEYRVSHWSVDGVAL